MLKRLSAVLSSIVLPCVLGGTVRVESGELSGTLAANREITVYKGVPYAAPPVGELRWRPPRAAVAWRGVRKADRFSDSCMQSGNSLHEITTASATGRSPFAPEFYPWKEPRSEDCLYLNVWTAAKSRPERRPVLVWLHGGGFVQGSGAVTIYDGEGLAAKGVVVVTLNYRLGVLGFFAHPDLTRESEHHASGNYGLMDQIAALNWVHRNIAAFGGDPNNVTIDGQSAGADSVCYLLASPLTRGLFHRAIAQSGGMFGPAATRLIDLSSAALRPLGEMEQAGVKFVQTHQASSLRALRAKPASDLLVPDTAFTPGIDGYVLPADVRSIYSRSGQNDVPLLIGWNSGDGTAFASDCQLPETADAFVRDARRRFDGMADRFLSIFPVNTDLDAVRVRADIARDVLFAWRARSWACLQSRTGKSKVYLYYFDLIPPGRRNLAIFGAHHSAEIVYAMNNLPTWDLPWTDQDRKLASAMSDYWVNFARTGNPNGSGLPGWPCFLAGNKRSMLLGEKIAAIPTPQKVELDFFDAWFAKERELR